MNKAKLLVSFFVVLLACSCASTTLPDTENVQPVALAGADQSISVGTRVELSGSASFDEDENSLIHRWLLESPVGSQANLSSTNFVETSFVPDISGEYVVTLVVNDGVADSEPDTVTIVAQGAGTGAPFARIENIDEGVVGRVITLDGSGSTDPNGTRMTYDWQIDGGPENSIVGIDDPAATITTFTPDFPGLYEVSLVVSNGDQSSSPTSIVIDVIGTGDNQLPIANAGIDQSVGPGAFVSLDGSNSSDADSDILTFRWAIFERPPGSVATLSDATIVNPSFVADVLGTYRLELVVSDGKVESAPSVVVVQVIEGNIAPSAQAGSDHSVSVSTTVTLDGSASSDANGDSLSYAWTLASKPATSSAVLSATTSATTTLTPDVEGTFVAELVVSDGTLTSSVDSITIIATANNTAPVAAAGFDQITKAGTSVTLDGGLSNDDDSDTLTFAWTLMTKPTASTLTFTSNFASTQFTPDAEGTYVISLVVNDGLVDSAADTMTVTASAPWPAAQGDIVITEIMMNPDKVSDSLGEWFEIYNPTNVAWDLEGCVISDLGSDSHTIAGALRIPPQSYRTFAKSTSAGFTASYVFGALVLANGDDEIVIECGANEVANILIDSPSFTITAGASIALLTTKYDEVENDDAANWCTATVAYSTGDFGTPNAANQFTSVCP